VPARADVLADVHVVLVRPRWASNLGAVARAMKNFGLQRLSLVDVRFSSWTEAWRLAVRAADVLEAAARHATLDDALAGARWVVGTTSTPPPGAAVLSPRDLPAAVREHGGATLLFGGEQHGLYPDELRRCHAVATIASAPAQPSLNLAQAVCVFAAELFAGAAPAAAAGADTTAAAPAALPQPHQAGSGTAPAELMRRLESALEHLLGGSSWSDATRPASAIGELMQPLWRARLSEQEVRLWLVALNKAAQPKRRG
jgi:TrmH family RNA methyltransferase